MRASIAALRLIVAALCFGATLVAGAQTTNDAAPANAPANAPAPAQDTAQAPAHKTGPTQTYGFDDEVTAQQQQQLVQPLNNKPVWDRVRSGVPLLSGLPIVGGVFGSQSDRKSSTELYLFLTPRIIRTDADADSVTAPRLGAMKQ